MWPISKRRHLKKKAQVDHQSMVKKYGYWSYLIINTYFQKSNAPFMEKLKKFQSLPWTYSGSRQLV